MLGRLLVGLIKGILVGVLLGFGLAKAGLAAPGAWIAYPVAAVAGVLVGLIAGKPIWAKDAKIEAGMKALVGALLGAGLMYAARSWLTFGVPLPLGELAQANTSLGEAADASGTFGGMAVTSLAFVSALLAGFYEADNTPGEDDGSEKKSSDKAPSKVRIAAAEDDDELEDEEIAEPTAKKTSKR